jgi:hypothetical protein
MNSFVNEKIYQGFDFKLGKYISEAFSLYKNNFFYFLLFGLTFNAIMVALSIVPMGAIALIAVLPCMMVGFSIIAYKIKKNEPFVFKDFFGAFKNFAPFLLNGLVILLLAMIVIVIVGILFTVLIFQNIGKLKGMGTVNSQFFMDLAYENRYMLITIGLVYLISTLYISISNLFSANLIHFFKYGAWDSFQTSRRIAHKSFFYLFIMLLIGLLINFSITLGTMYFLYGNNFINIYVDFFKNLTTDQINNQIIMQEFQSKMRYFTLLSGLIGAIFVPFTTLMTFCAFDDMMDLTKDIEQPDSTADHLITE